MTASVWCGQPRRFEGEVVVEPVDALLVLGPVHEAAGEYADLHGPLAQAAADGGMVADGLGHDVARPGQRVGRRGHGFAEIGPGQRLGRLVRRGLGQNQVSQRPQPPLAGDGGAGAALGSPGGVEVFEGVECPGRLELRPQLRRQLALLVDRGDDGRAAFVEGAQPLDLGGDVADLLLVERAGGLLAIAGDEGQGVAVIEQGDDGRDLPRADVELFGDALFVNHMGHRLPGFGRKYE